MPSSFPVVFVWFLIAIFIFQHHLRKSSKAQEKVSSAFWNKEESSLVVRKKALEPEAYVQIHLTQADLKSQDYYQALGVEELYRQDRYLRDLMTQPMVNFEHVSNTDLRLTYGTAMITMIETYEDTFNAYTATLYKMGDKLMKVEDHDYACKLLEEAVAVGTENGKCYLLLAKHYKATNQAVALENLIKKANDLKSLTKDALLKELTRLLYNN